MAALRAGYGIAICQCGIGDRDPSLLRLFADSFELHMDTWVVMHEDLRRNALMRALYDHLATLLMDYANGASLPGKRTLRAPAKR